MTKPGEAVQLPNSAKPDPTVVHDPSTIVVEHNPKDPNSPTFTEHQLQTIHDSVGVGTPVPAVQVPPTV